MRSSIFQERAVGGRGEEEEEEEEEEEQGSVMER